MYPDRPSDGPLVTVLLTVYTQRPQLDTNIETALNQTVRHDELAVFGAGYDADNRTDDAPYPVVRSPT